MKKWPVPTISLFGSFVIRIIGRIIYIDKQKQVIMRLRGLLKINSPGILFYTFSIFQKLKDTEWDSLLREYYWPSSQLLSIFKEEAW